jgi:hypothetical protein
LLGVIEPYADIWAKYVLPNRTPTGESAQEPWRAFASNHYTALIRLQNATLFKSHIDRVCCEKCEGTQLLEIQAYTSAFWWSLGAVVDNLGQAIENFPGMDLSSIADDEEKEFQAKGKKYICAQVPDLGFSYDRRTQHIHSRTIPIGAIDGHPYFDTRYLDGPHKDNLPKDTRWKEDYNNVGDLAKFYDDQWQGKLKSMITAWCHMRCLFADIAKQEKPKGRRSFFDKLKFNSAPTSAIPAQTIYAPGLVAMASAFYPTVIRYDTNSDPGASGFKSGKK